MKLSLYDSILYLVGNNYINARVLKFNYDKKTIVYNGIVVVSGSECLSEYFLGIPVKNGLSLDVNLGNTFIETLEELYGKYYLSERGYTRGVNFVSKKSDNSSDILSLLKYDEAEYNRVKLESFLYCVIVGGLYEWEFDKDWYWVSSKYRRLYLYKRWFQSNLGGS